MWGGVPKKNVGRGRQKKKKCGEGSAKFSPPSPLRISNGIALNLDMMMVYQMRWQNAITENTNTEYTSTWVVVLWIHFGA